MFDSLETSIIGPSAAHTPDWQMQTLPDACALVSEMSIINQFGHNLTQEDAAYISASHGWYQPGTGTSASAIGNMMDLYNIPNHQVMNASVADLAQELQQGHGVIVGVRSSELWDSGPLSDLLHFLCKTFGFDNSTYSPADHAVVVTGIDVSDPSNPQVLLNDSGVPGGEAVAYPLDKFLDAWENSNFYYTATDEPLPSNDMDALDNFDWAGCAKYFVGGAVGIYVALSTGNPLVGIQAGVAAGTMVEEFFADPQAINRV